MAFRYAGFADEAGKTLEEQIRATRALGWDGIEVRQVGAKNFCDLTDAEFDEAMAKLAAGRIVIASFGSQIANWSRRITSDLSTDVAELRRNIPRMHRAGTKIIRCMSYPNADPPWAKSDWKAEVVRRLRELARIAADGGVILAHENCSGYGGEGPDEVLELLDAVSNDAFQIIFDTGNQPHGGKSGLYEYYEKVKDHVVHVHVKATKLADGKRQICFADEDSDGTPRRVFQDLKKRRYDGWVSIEPHLAAQVHLGTTPGDTRTATDLYVEYGRRLMKLIDAIP